MDDTEMNTPSKSSINEMPMDKAAKYVRENFAGEIFVEECNGKYVYFANQADVNLFGKIFQWKKDNPDKNIDDCLKEFISAESLKHGVKDHADAIIKVLYDYPMVDYVLKYQDHLKFESVRAPFERKLLHQGLILEHNAYDVHETFVKIYTPFAVLAVEAHKKNVKMPLIDPDDALLPLNDQEDEGVDVEQLEEAKSKAMEKVREKAKQKAEDDQLKERTLTVGSSTAPHQELNQDVIKEQEYSINLPSTTMELLKRVLYFFDPNDSVRPSASALFRLENLSKFRGGNEFNPCNGNDSVERVVMDFFPRVRRNLITYYVLTRVLLSPKELREINNKHIVVSHAFGINHLVNAEVYTEYFPIHDGPSNPNVDPPNTRSWLRKNWASYTKVAHYQPLDVIRDYFGEKVALYFAFAGFYTTWLWPAALVGLAVFFYGISYAISLRTFSDLSLNNLNNLEAGSGRVFDNPAIIPFSAFMCVWATVFIEFWKRKNSYLSWWWDVMNFEQIEIPRPEWYGTRVRVSPITGKKEYYYPEKVRKAKMLASFCCIGFAILIVVVAVVAVVVYTAWSENYWGQCSLTQSAEYNYCIFHQNNTGFVGNCTDGCYKLLNETVCLDTKFTIGTNTYQACQWSNSTCYPPCSTYKKGIPCLTNPFAPKIDLTLYQRTACSWNDVYFRSDISTAVLNLIAILMLSQVFEYVALQLNNWENHKTSTIWEDSLITKTFFFQFLNSYTIMFYIAFFKGTVANNIFGNPSLSDECYYGSCFNQLMIQLAIVFVGKQFVNQFVELAIPLGVKFFKINMGKRAQAVSMKKQENVIREENVVTEGMVMDSELAPQWVKDAYLDQDQSVLYDDYSELAIQFGFITLFVPAFPLAPFFALLNNFFEIRTDAYKMVNIFQRPPGLQAKDIGTWQDIMNVLGIVAVITNAFMLGFTSNWVGDELETIAVQRDWNEVLAARLILVIIFEHTIIFLKMVIAYAIPDIPYPVKLAIDRENYLARLALEGIQEEEEAQDDGDGPTLKDLFTPVFSDINKAGQNFIDNVTKLTQSD